jgi:hypothetical protein
MKGKRRKDKRERERIYMIVFTRVSSSMTWREEQYFKYFEHFKTREKNIITINKNIPFNLESKEMLFVFQRQNKRQRC